MYSVALVAYEKLQEEEGVLLAQTRIFWKSFGGTLHLEEMINITYVFFLVASVPIGHAVRKYLYKTISDSNPTRLIFYVWNKSITPFPRYKLFVDFDWGDHDEKPWLNNPHYKQIV